MNQYIKQSIIDGKTSLGIEFGSTRIKAVLIDENFKTIGSGIYDWENKLIDGYWTYDLNDMVKGLQDTYAELRKNIKNRYGVNLERIGSIGCSAMMQGYIALNSSGELLVPFRTWRNLTTENAASKLTELFQFKIPQRWTVAHLYQAILENEEHVKDIAYITTLSGYMHCRLTGQKVLGIGDSSGMFPIDESTKTHNDIMLTKFSDLVAEKNYAWNIKNILPKVLRAGEHAGNLTEAGARLLDPTGGLKAGVSLCPPEGDAATGMIATNSIKKSTGNISVGTAIFAMIVLERDLSKVYPEIDLINTPDGSPVAMVLANNCSGDINAWANLFRESHEAMGLKTDNDHLYQMLLNKALEGDADGGGLLSYGYYSGENITGLSQGRPIFVRSPKSKFNLANFMRVHLFSAFAALKLGLDILTEKENMQIDSILGHGGLFKTPQVAQKMLAAALNVPVSVMSTAGEGGAWGMAILATYMTDQDDIDLPDYLSTKVFDDEKEQTIYPNSSDVDGFHLFMERYKRGLAIEQSAVDHLLENSKN